MSAEIIVPLTQGKTAVIDVSDGPLILIHKWFSARARVTMYAHRTGWIDGRNVTIRMHRVIARALAGQHVDHINGDTLDNRRSNLRICTISENARNATKRKGVSMYKGVSLSNTGNRWVANIYDSGRLKFLGSFTSEEDAARAYDVAAKQIFGEFARPNFAEQPTWR